tara:strand:+ start:308 stop:484 length:177 start_codon:yes stop_codon:yes gene_type:complete
MKKLLLFILLTTCSTPQSNIEFDNNNFDYKDDISFNDYKKKLEKYNKNNSYPRIDTNL